MWAENKHKLMQMAGCGLQPACNVHPNNVIRLPSEPVKPVSMTVRPLPEPDSDALSPSQDPWLSVAAHAYLDGLGLENEGGKWGGDPMWGWPRGLGPDTYIQNCCF